MKNRFFLLLSFLLPIALFAENIPVDKAREIATDFFVKNQMQHMAIGLQMVNDGETPSSRQAGSDPAYYVFDNSNGKGFVIIAGDDIAVPILGYSLENDFPEEIPCNVKDWLDGIKEEINDARSRGEHARNTLLAPNTGDVIVQLNTPKWDQGSPYNNYTPKVDVNQTWTGCTITATAIVMRYHQWPAAGTGTVPGYTTSTRKIEMAERKLGHTYEWDMMPYEYKWGKYSLDEAHQVAQLMADLGVMLQADYNTDGTGAACNYIPSALIEYMDYDKSALFCNRYSYSTDDWHALMKKELDENRPVIYSGFNDKAGHAFVLDGYTTTDYFSVNWGWGGSCNGYFRLNAMVPSGSGIGGNNDHYNYNQGAVIGLKKNEGGDYVIGLTLGEKGLSTNVTEFNLNQPFILYWDWLGNSGGTVFNGSILFALTDREGTVKQEFNRWNVEGLLPLYGWAGLNIQCTITKPMAIGDRIRILYQPNGASEWTLIKGGDECTWEIPVTDEYAIDETTQLAYDKQTGNLHIKTKEGVQVSLLHADGTAIQQVAGTEANEVVFATESLPTETYTLKLTKTFESYEVKLKLGRATDKNL